jgi:hypothetical protein
MKTIQNKAKASQATIDKNLKQPLLDLLSEDKFEDKYLRTLKYVTATTGTGKTYLCFNAFLQKLNKMKIKHLVYTCPTKDALASAEQEALNANLGKYITHTARTFLRNLKRNKKSILFLCNSSVVNECVDNARCLQTKIYQHKNFKKVAFFIDEIHLWCISGTEYERQMKCRTNSSPEFQAKMYKTLNKFSEKTPYIFGATATPNLEQEGILDVAGDLKFLKVNKKTNGKNELIFSQKWVDEKKSCLFSYQNGYQYIKKGVGSILNFNKNVESRFGKFKKSLLIECRSTPKSSTYHADHRYTLIKTCDYIVKILSELDDNAKICIMNCDGNRLYNKNGWCGWGGSDNQVFEKMEDISNPLTILLVDRKATAGVNIRNLGGLICLKDTERKYKVGPAYRRGFHRTCYNPNYKLQLLGRMVRLFANIDSSKKFKEKNFLGNSPFYSLHDYILTKRSSYAFSKLYKVNSFFVYMLGSKTNQLAYNAFFHGVNNVICNYDYWNPEKLGLKEPEYADYKNGIWDPEYKKAKKIYNDAKWVKKNFTPTGNTLNEARKAVRELRKSA